MTIALKMILSAVIVVVCLMILLVLIDTIADDKCKIINRISDTLMANLIKILLILIAAAFVCLCVFVILALWEIT